MHGLDSTLETIRREIDSALSERESTVRRSLASDLSQFVRRLRQYKNESEWISAVLDAAKRFVEPVAIMTLTDGQLNVRGEYGFNVPADLAIPITSAQAFEAAIKSRESVVALRTPSEVGEAFAIEQPSRAQIVPIANGSRIVALLISVPASDADLDFLELIAEISSGALERQANAGIHTQIAAAGNSGATKSDMPAWTELSERLQNIHVRAQRFSRVKVAEMQASRPEAFRAGIDESDVYLYLKPEIDRARELFCKDFANTASMVDYLHMELVRAAAGDENKLGTDYPGQLI